MVMSGDEPHRCLIHDRDSIYSEGVDRTIAAMGLTILKTPARAPQANAFCERVIGTIRRECLDWMIPLNEGRLRRVRREWVAHYNRRPPHASLGPGIPDGLDIAPVMDGHRIVTRTVSSPSRFSVVFITSTVLSRGRPDHVRGCAARFCESHAFLPAMKIERSPGHDLRELRTSEIRCARIRSD